MIGEVHSGETPSLPQHGNLFSTAGLRVTSGTRDLPHSEHDAHWLTCYRYDNNSYSLNFSRSLPLFKAIINISEKNGVFCREWFAFLRSILSQEDYPLSVVLSSKYTFTTTLSVWMRPLLHPQREEASCCFVTAVLMGTCGEPSERGDQ
jgi:hypothetical protein